jgi:hypothetical protein
MPGSKWLAVKKAVTSMSQLRTLMRLKPSTTTNIEFEPESEESEINRASKTMMEFIEGDFKLSELVSCLHSRRIYALARTIGLNYLNTMIKSASPESLKQVQGLVSSVYSEAFCYQGVKRHYTFGIEGADPVLIKAVQTAFFTMYQNLLN